MNQSNTPQVIVQALSASDHSREAAGLTYVYPVISRRAGGVSIGVNLNTNNACNWQCVYCQVPNLSRGGPLPVDMALLESELRGFIQELLVGDFMQTRVPEDARRIVDVALSGNGEPTSAPEFAAVVALIGRVLADTGLAGKVPPRLISNGSLLGRERVQDGLAQLGHLGGEVWFKVDAGSTARMALINGTQLDADSVARRLARCAGLCPTWVQTCVFALDGQRPSRGDIDDYLALLNHARTALADAPAHRPEVAGLKGVLLYGLARPSLQPDANRLSSLPHPELEAIADRIRQMGWLVRVSP